MIAKEITSRVMAERRSTVGKKRLVRLVQRRIGACLKQ